MSHRDEYYNRAKVEGYRSRAAFKLKQLDEAAGLFGDGNTVVDLGAAPGGWLQVAAERVGPEGKVIGVDFQRIDDVDRPAPVETIRGDMTEPETRERIRALLAGAEDPRYADDPDAVDGDALSSASADVVLSDMAPNLTGEYSVDHARSVHLARQALETALEVLDTGGDLAVKVFDGRDLDDFVADVEAEFQYARRISPDASRDSSSELYVVGKHRITAPVREGDVLAVEITDVGSEGDGVAKVEEFTLFVDGAETGDVLEVEVTGVKPRFGFAEPVGDAGEE